MSVLAFLVSVAISSAPGQNAPVDGSYDVGIVCDRLAGALNDPMRSPAFPGVLTGGGVDGFTALEACRKAASRMPGVARYRFQYARTLIWSGRSEQAAPILQKLVDEKYVAAFAVLGQAYRIGDGVPQDSRRAYELLREAGDRGDPEGNLQLGYLYRFDDGSYEDFEAAVKAFEKAWAAGEAEAAVQLGDAYAHGYGVRRDREAAVAYFRKADAAGDPDGADGVGLAYEFGWGVKPNIEEAKKWYERAATLGSRWGHVHLANLLYSNPGGDDDLAAAIRHYRVAAELAVNGAQYGLGNAYSEGRGVPKDARLARDWFERAIVKDNLEAMNNLGVLYMDGALSRDGKTPNLEMGLSFYEKAAALGNAISMLNLGVRLENAAAAPPEPEKIVTWYQRAAFAGNIDAMVRLGQIYLNDEYGFGNVTLAFLWNRRSAEAGNAGAMTNLGWAYDMGLGVAVDPAKAAHWYREAASGGDPNAMNNLGVMYLNGEGVARNPRTAFDWYAKAIHSGRLPLAHFNVAELYRDGAGVKRSPRKAAQHLIAALESGSPRAFQSLTADAKLWSPKVWKHLQAALARRGLYEGPIDGHPLLPTRKAVVALYLKGGGSL